MEPLVFTFEMAVVLGLLGITVFLFVFEIIRVDLAALLILVTVGILRYMPGLSNLADVTHLFDGFASNAVISIIAVMIIGEGGVCGTTCNSVFARYVKCWCHLRFQLLSRPEQVQHYLHLLWLYQHRIHSLSQRIRSMH